MKRRSPALVIRVALVATMPFTFAPASKAMKVTPGHLRNVDEDAKLNAKVSISRGVTSLAKVLEELSAKSGLAILPADTIKERRMTIDMVDVPVRTVLVTIAEAYDWRLYQQQPGTYVVDRRTFRAPADPRSIPAAMQSVLPKDMRVFMKLPDLATNDPAGRSMNAALPVVSSAGAASIARLKSALADVFSRQDSLPVANLTADQRKGLLAWLVFDQMRYTLEILNDNDGPHRYDPSQFELLYRQSELGLDVITAASVMPGLAFGTQIFFGDGRPIPADFGRAKAP